MHLPQRRIHLGIDYGTSQSKLVLRDYGRRGGDFLGDYAVVVRPTREEGGCGDFRIPSTVTHDRGRLWFGYSAEQKASESASICYRSLKVLMALPDDFHGLRAELPEGLDAEDLATLYVLYLIQRGHVAIKRYTAKISVRLQMSITLGVPMNQLDHKELKEMFLRVIRIALNCFRMESCDLLDGITVSDARLLMDRARSEIDWSQPVIAEDWVRAEASAALIWSFRSPQITPGLYAVVDVGAGTCSSSWFRIADSFHEGNWVKSRMAFFGAASNAPGADAVEQAIALSTGVRDPATLRGKINSMDVTDVPGLSKVCDEIFRTYQLAFGRAYPKNKLQSRWYGAKLFLIGGGTLIEVVRRRLQERAWSMLEQDPPLVDPGHPADLFEENGEAFAGEPTFLLVAYGLSHLAADVPEIVNPNDVPKFTPLSLRVSELHHEELYME
jgi:hypothetical protein